MHTRHSTAAVAPGRPAVVLVHGLVVSSRYMIPTAEQLAPFYRVYIPDLPGFGRSRDPRRTLTVDELAGALGRWLRATGIDRAVLVGNSMGCQVIAALAARGDERVERIVLQGPSMDRFARTPWQQGVRFVTDSLREPPSSIPIMLRDIWDAGVGRGLLTFRYALQDRPEDRLPAIHVPALVVRGSRDPIVSQRWAEEVASGLPLGRLVIVPGAAHVLNYSHPQRFADLVRAFIEESAAPTRPGRVTAPVLCSP